MPHIAVPPFRRAAGFPASRRAGCRSRDWASLERREGAAAAHLARSDGPAVACRHPPELTGRAMSAWISAADSDRLYTRISSSMPRNHSDQIELPPKRSGCVLVTIGPVWSRVLTCTPLTNNRTAVPSYVTARCDHVFSDSALVPTADSSPPDVLAWPLGNAES